MSAWDSTWPTDDRCYVWRDGEPVAMLLRFHDGRWHAFRWLASATIGDHATLQDTLAAVRDVIGEAEDA